jgi:hypothetical protein
MKMPISTDVRTGSSRLQPIYDSGPLFVGLAAARDAEFLTQPATDKHERLLEQNFLRWRRTQDVINAEIHRQYLARAEEIGMEVEADRRKQMLADVDAQQAEYAAADAAENQQYLDRIAAAKQKREADWRKQATARLAKATRAINADINRRDRELLKRKRR